MSPPSSKCRTGIFACFICKKGMLFPFERKGVSFKVKIRWFSCMILSGIDSMFVSNSLKTPWSARQEAGPTVQPWWKCTYSKVGLPKIIKPVPVSEKGTGTIVQGSLSLLSGWEWLIDLPEVTQKSSKAQLLAWARRLWPSPVHFPAGHTGGQLLPLLASAVQASFWREK